MSVNKDLIQNLNNSDEKVKKNEFCGKVEDLSLCKYCVVHFIIKNVMYFFL